MAAALDDILLETEDLMDKAFEFVRQQFAGLRTGKASVSMVDHLAVSYYGSSVRLREIANISTPDVRLIVINAYDPTALGAIEKAIIAANLGIEIDDFEYAPFNAQGGLGKVHQLFGAELHKVIEELNRELAA